MIIIIMNMFVINFISQDCLMNRTLKRAAFIELYIYIFAMF